MSTVWYKPKLLEFCLLDSRLKREDWKSNQTGGDEVERHSRLEEHDRSWDRMDCTKIAVQFILRSWLPINVGERSALFRKFTGPLSSICLCIQGMINNETIDVSRSDDVCANNRCSGGAPLCVSMVYFEWKIGHLADILSIQSIIIDHNEQLNDLVETGGMVPLEIYYRPFCSILPITWCFSTFLRKY